MSSNLTTAADYGYASPLSEPYKGRFTMKGQIKEYRSGKWYVRLYYKGELRIYNDHHKHPIESKGQAQRLLESIRYEIDNNIFNKDKYKKDKTNFNFKNLYGEWLKRKTGEYRRILESFNTNHFKHLWQFDIHEIRKSHVEDLMLSLTISPVNIIKTLHAFLQWAYDTYEIQVIFPKFPTLKIPEAETTYLDENQQQLVLEHIDKFYYAPVMFCVFQGVRPIECRNLKWSDINLDRGTVTIRHSKTGRITVQPLHPEMIKIFESMPKVVIDGYVFRGKSTPQLERCILNKVWQRACDKAGIRCTFYEGTRHSLASQAAIRGESILHISRFYGHTSTKVTERYAKVNAASMSNVLNISKDINRIQDKNTGRK